VTGKAPRKRGFFVFGTVAAQPAGTRSDDGNFGMKGETVARVTLWLLWSLWTLA